MSGSNKLGTFPGSLLLAGDLGGTGTTLTFANGVTKTGTTVTNDLITGKAGGQTATGGTAASEGLTLQSTTNATKGKIFFGAAQLSWIDEAATGAAQTGTSAVLTLGLPNGANFVNIIFNVNSVKKAAISGTSGGFLSFAAGSGGHVFYLGDFGQYHQFFNSNGNALLGPGATEDNAANLVKLVIAKSVASAAGAAWDGFRLAAPALTLTGSTNVTELGASRFEVPTMTAGSVLTVTDAATFIIDGAPVAGGSLAFGSADAAAGAKAIWIKGGAARFDGGIVLKTIRQLQSVGGDLSLSSSNNIILTPTGANRVQFNNAGSFSANAAVATVLGSVGPTGSRTTVQKWLTISDSAGNPFYIPCF